MWGLRGGGGPASRRSRAPAAAVVCSRRAPPRSHSARRLPPRPTLGAPPRARALPLRQPLGGRDEFPDPPLPTSRGARGPRLVRVRGGLGSFRGQAPARAPGAAERAASRVLTARRERPSWATRGRCGAGGTPPDPPQSPAPSPPARKTHSPQRQRGGAGAAAGAEPRTAVVAAAP